MKSTTVFGLVLGAALFIGHTASAASSKSYSCFTDGYEPGTSIEFSTDANGAPLGFKTFNAMPDGSQANVEVYGGNVSTTSILEDGKTAYTGWNFASMPVPEATLILEKYFKSGVLVVRRENLPTPKIDSISCKEI